jgi:hypothetical protein
VSSRVFAGALLACGLLANLPLSAAGIAYDCASNIETSTCTYLNTNIAGLYAGVFVNANAKIFIQYGSTGLGQSQQYYNSTTYNDYLTALTAHEGDATDVTAVGTLPNTEPAIFANGSVYLTSALSQVLGIPVAAGLGGQDGVNVGLGQCTLGTTACYNGIVTLANPAGQYYYRTGTQTGSQYDIYSVVQHETNEVLGTSSCIGTVNGLAGDVCAGTGVNVADLFRYSAPGTRSFVSQGSGTLAYMSFNGGATSIASYTNSPGIGDYGDWSTNCAHVQDATGCLGQSFNITSNGAVEITALDIVGFNLVSTPEPATTVLLTLGLLALIQYRRRSLHR